MTRLALRRLAAAALLAGCVSAAPRRAPGPASTAGPLPARPAPAGQPAVASCFNAQYDFTCALPDGYLLTREGSGPGEVLALVHRSLGSAEEAGLSVRVAPLGPTTLPRFVERRIARDLKRATGIVRWEKRDASYGGWRGVEIDTERAYANGTYRSRIFCFVEGRNVFIVDHRVPAHRFEREQGVLEEFVGNLTFGAAGPG